MATIPSDVTQVIGEPTLLPGCDMNRAQDLFGDGATPLLANEIDHGIQDLLELHEFGQDDGVIQDEAGTLINYPITPQFSNFGPSRFH